MTLHVGAQDALLWLHHVYETLKEPSSVCNTWEDMWIMFKMSVFGCADDRWTELLAAKHLGWNVRAKLRRVHVVNTNKSVTTSPDTICIGNYRAACRRLFFLLWSLVSSLWPAAAVSRVSLIIVLLYRNTVRQFVATSLGRLAIQIASSQSRQRGFPYSVFISLASDITRVKPAPWPPNPFQSPSSRALP